MKMNKLQRLKALEAAIKKDSPCEWSFKPMRDGEYNQIVDACIEGNLDGLKQLLTRHGVSDVADFRDNMLRVLSEMVEDY
ncbi:hypothetical protein [Escherichia coli]|uniref:hypothetical protein n=1 Tax=Escherichia coli TaxID=562 RepID=UPI000B955A4B|nr:hypothetical protein [Escherichia coli]OYJ73365.1 hypothetical protein CI668_12305 [Escherichia coli]